MCHWGMRSIMLRGFAGRGIQSAWLRARTSSDVRP
jgi:hypothetical protein